MVERVNKMGWWELRSPFRFQLDNNGFDWSRSTESVFDGLYRSSD